MSVDSKVREDTVLQGTPGVCCSIDDSLVSTPDEDSDIHTLETRLTTHGF